MGKYELAGFKGIEIAIVSIICALEQFNQIGFRNQWIQLIENKIGIDIERIDALKRTLIRVLLVQTSPNDIGKLNCISSDSVGTCLRRNPEIDKDL